MNNQKNKKRLFLVIIVLLFPIIFISLYIVNYYYLPNFKQISFYKYFDELDKNKISIILEGKRMEVLTNPIKKDNEIFIPVDFVKDNIDQYIFWDSGVKKLTITTGDKVIRLKTEDLTYYVNNKPTELNIPVYEINNECFMPVSMLEELYNIDIEYKDLYNFIIIDFKEKPKILGTLVEKSNLRYKPDKKSYIEEKLKTGDQVFLFGETGDFTRIRTVDGLLGYVETKNIGNINTIEPIIVNNNIPEVKIPIEGRINLLWDYVSSVEANTLSSKRIYHEGVNVISPCWFTFDLDKLNGDIINIADKSYVDWAHSVGYQVWPRLVDEKSSVGSKILSNTLHRENTIKQILAFVALYKLDGINIDLEQITPHTADYFIQFLRELSPLLKEQNIVLSVDMYVPTYTKYYNRTEVQKVVDYICVMSYDEHSAIDNAGPLASFNFVKNGILDTMKEVPHEKIIMGIPFYSRVYRNDKHYGAYGMDAARKMFEKEGAVFEWDEALKLYFASFKKNENGEEVLYEVWLEEQRAIEEKMILVKEYDLGGVCLWVRGLQNDEVFESIKKRLN